MIVSCRVMCGQWWKCKPAVGMLKTDQNTTLTANFLPRDLLHWHRTHCPLSDNTQVLLFTAQAQECWQLATNATPNHDGNSEDTSHIPQQGCKCCPTTCFGTAHPRAKNGSMWFEAGLLRYNLQSCATIMAVNFCVSRRNLYPLTVTSYPPQLQPWTVLTYVLSLLHCMTLNI